MYKVILVDDEPLILAGIASLIPWEDHDCTIIAKATNGPSAYDMILELQPDIVITDIRMPVLNGLELIEKCSEAHCQFAFLVLTNLEDFQLARKALSLGASDYLVKLNMSPEELIQALNRAKSACDMMAHHRQAGHVSSAPNTEELIHNYFNEILIAQKQNIQPPQPASQSYSRPFVLLFSIRHNHIRFQPQEEQGDLKVINTQITDIISGIAARFFKTFTLLNYTPFHTFVLAASLRENSDFESTIGSFCTKTNSALKTYFELNAVFGISHLADSLDELPALLLQAQTALEYYYYDSARPVVFFRTSTFIKAAQMSLISTF